MDHDRIILDKIRSQNYPLSIDAAAAEVMVKCINIILSMVSEDDRILVRGEYDMVTSALCHPVADGDESNERF